MASIFEYGTHYVDRYVYDDGKEKIWVTGNESLVEPDNSIECVGEVPTEVILFCARNNITLDMLETLVKPEDADSGPVHVGRHIEGITLNPLEFLLDDDTQEPLVFENQKAAEVYLMENGVDEDELDYFHYVAVVS